MGIKLLGHVRIGRETDDSAELIYQMKRNKATTSLIAELRCLLEEHDCKLQTIKPKVRMIVGKDRIKKSKIDVSVKLSPSLKFRSKIFI